MKTINCLRDLDPFGIHPLTGEADNLSFRELCDVTEQGQRIVAETYGLRAQPCRGNWNHGDPPHVGSVMLPHGAWRDLGIVALLTEGHCHTVLLSFTGLWGLQAEEEYRRAEWDWADTSQEPVLHKAAQIYRDGEWMDWPEDAYGKVGRVFSFGDHPRQGTRNLHAMSGRTV